MNDKVSLSCTSRTVAGVVTVRLEAVNQSSAPVHVLASKRLPYVMFEQGRAIVMYGVNEPDPEIDYYHIEIPPSRALAPGETLVAEVRVVPLVPHHHYESKTAPVTLAAELEVVCKLAYGDAPTDPAKMAIQGLLAWQHWVTAPTLRVATDGATP